MIDLKELEIIFISKLI